ncbi:MAG: lysine biosynthesis protein LysX [Candidatus Nitrosotenuis sp.]|uniref:Lysine biosynthesis enzyme LysX n=1 Tax=Candidatus Nitrosotenuis uzonensis TaxID=1407055 RepID=V6ATH3_9ARCH|nr:lysine biosynthesis protein LysX [Candidatus Nitrosotenuis uzonensis]CAE6496232.1 Lysine biosynthesis enzyme LysX [Candidatus Nitrosotenuis uzonensis]CDI06016.1 Lysine biosynthesis enzyme LysX [Candidatus Nitrosotenuis uzonensis]
MSPPISVLYDTIRLEEKALVESAKKRGINIQMVDCRNLVIDLDKKSDFGTVLQRCVSYYRNLHSTAALEGAGANVINSLHTGIYAGNKLFTHMLLKKAGINTPYVTVAFTKESALEALDSLGYPRVIKPTVGSWGRMVTKLNSKEAAEGIIEEREKMYPIYQIHYLEEFVQRPPRDIRAVVIGDSVVGAIYRNSGDGNWKTNTHLGGTAEVCKVTPELEDICIKAKNAVKGQIVGIDLMESTDRGLVVHEINNTTEYRNVARVTGTDIAGLILEYAVNSGK